MNRLKRFVWNWGPTSMIVFGFLWMVFGIPYFDTHPHPWGAGIVIAPYMGFVVGGMLLSFWKFWHSFSSR